MTDVAALTVLDPVYPGYVNLKYDPDTSEFVLTVRGDPALANGIVFAAGNTVQLRLSASEAHRWTLDAHKLVTGGR